MIRRERTSVWVKVAALRFLLVGVACAPAADMPVEPRGTLFIGVDVSGSFEKDGRYDDAMSFAAHYIHAHLHGHGELDQPRALFVGAIGGERPGQPQAFHPIHDFEGKDIDQIESDLRGWFQPDNRLTDFNAFFQRAATLVKRQNLALAPVTMVLLTDGLPDLGRNPRPEDGAEPYRAIDLHPLEYLARNVTVRVLYPEPTVAVSWERDVPRDRVRLWTVDNIVMRGWSEQLEEAQRPAATTTAASLPPSAVSLAEGVRDAVEQAAGGAGEEKDPPAAARGPDPDYMSAERAAMEDAPRYAAEQPLLWRWIRDNVDFRVRRSVL